MFFSAEKEDVANLNGRNSPQKREGGKKKEDKKRCMALLLGTDLSKQSSCFSVLWYAVAGSCECVLYQGWLWLVEGQ